VICLATLAVIVVDPHSDFDARLADRCCPKASPSGIP
jgi:hypothetical protein